MRIRSLFLPFLAWLMLSGTVAAEEKIVRFTTTHYPPYLDEKAEGKGFFTEIVREAFRKQGYRVIVDFYPWKRAVVLANDALGYDGIFTFGTINEERRIRYVISDPMPSVEWGFFKRNGANVPYEQVSDLRDLRVGIVRGYAYSKEFDSQKDSFSALTEVNSDTKLLQMLALGRLDVIVMDRYFGQYHLNRDLRDIRDKVEYMQPPLTTQAQWLAISRKAENFQQKMDAFNRGLAQITISGALDAIMKGNYLY